MKPVLALQVLASLLLVLASAAPGEANGTVTNVIDGDTLTTGELFVGSKRHETYHYPTSWWAKEILPENEILFISSGEARAAGYVPCGACHPP